MNVFRKSWLIFKFLGPGWVAFRVGYALRRRLGALRRNSPCQPWSMIPAVARLPDWLRTPAWPARGKEWGSRCIAEADGLSLGEFVLFSLHARHLGLPPDWHRNPFSGQSAPRGRHWSALGDFAFGDIKTIWEQSRFGWAFTLVRAHARTGEARFADLFWRLFEDWCAQNPPNEGVNWKCGQEATFRLMAVTFALSHFGRLPSATDERLQLWARFVTATGQRIEANLSYALSQSNNHGISECVGLVTASLLAEDSVAARRWRELGSRKLAEQLHDLIYADGGFSQHSLIYHRVVLHDLLWLVALWHQAGLPPLDWLVQKARMALVFLTRLVDANTGLGPLYGSNDGANVLPLDDGVFLDMRGVLAAGHALLNGARIYPSGPWDEAAFWLTGRDPRLLPLQTSDNLSPRWHGLESGVFLWSSQETRLFLRCPVFFRHRPDHADMLHADITWRGRPVAHDTGSYGYNTTGVFDGALEKAEAHNLLMIEGRETLEKAGRFLCLPWPTGTTQWSEADQSFRATHDGYRAAARVERRVFSPRAGVFRLTDRVELRHAGRVRLHWLLADADWKLDTVARTLTATLAGERFTLSWESDLPVGAATLVRADPASARGWWSRHYLAADPAVSFALVFDVPKALTVSTQFAPGGA